MNPQDHNYLRLQFLLKIHELNGAAFQHFCENILQKAFPDFIKIKPHGKLGDRGNDGFRKAAGIYYQMYAPEVPQINQLEAAKKAKRDFLKVKEAWNQIAEVREYYFVFNDKGDGSTLPLEQALSELSADNPAIKFAALTASGLERLFFSLSQEDMLALGFDIDLMKATGMGYRYLDHVKLLVDRGNAKLAENALIGMQAMLTSLQDPSLLLEYDLLRCHILQLSERAEDALGEYDNLSKRFKADVRPLLGMAAIHLDRENFTLHQQLVDRAKEIDPDNPLVRLQELVYMVRRHQKIDTTQIEEQSFPEDRRQKSNFYRIYAAHLGLAHDMKQSRIFIEHAIEFNPNRLQNYFMQLELLQEENLLFSAAHEKAAGKRKILEVVDSIQERALKWGEITPRTEAQLNCTRIVILQQLDEIQELLPLAKPTAHLLLKCNFDHLIDHLLVHLLFLTEWPPDDLSALLVYLKESVKAKRPTLMLSKGLVFQFLGKGSLLSEGKAFFDQIDQPEMKALISAVEGKNYEEVWALLSADLPFATAFAAAAKTLPELRWKIVSHLPDDVTIQKQRLLLLLNYEEDKVEEAFQILRTVDLSQLNYAEAEFVLKLARQKEAWDFVVTLLNRLLEQKSEKHLLVQRRLQLVQALFNLERFTEAAELGEVILADNEELSMVAVHHQEWLASQTVLAHFRHGDHDKALAVLEKYHQLISASEFHVGLGAQVYLNNKLPEKALASVITGLRLIGKPTAEDYGSLFYITTSIANALQMDGESIKSVVSDSFVKVKGQDRWYFVGDGQPLDATFVPTEDPKYNEFIDKKVSDKISFPVKYSSTPVEYTVERILLIEQYVCWKSAHDAQQLTREHRWDKMEMIEIPMTGDSIDPKFLIARLEDEQQKSHDMFDLYCKQLLPMAFLSISQGGLTGAIGIISNEQRGFVHICPNEPTAIARQHAAAKRIIGGDAFYIDGTSALFLSETGLLTKLMPFLPGLHVPQSVISYLLDTKERFAPTPGQVGHMQYVQQRLRISPTDEGRAQELRRRFQESIVALEKDPKRCVAISAANKSDCLTEKRVPPALIDACILAQRDKMLVLTEDYLLLQADELETGKPVPDHCSTFILMRELLNSRKIPFDLYLEYFAYLASYRCRFLPLSTEDFERAVFGENAITLVRPDRLRLFDFSLTLSEDYGVPFDTALRVVALFVIRIVADDSVFPDVAKQIFSQVLTTFPTKKDRRIVGRTILEVCRQVLSKTGNDVGTVANKREKLDTLSQYVETVLPGSILLP